MNRVLLILFLVGVIHLTSAQDQYISRQGEMTFFSYTSVENIEATNNQVLSLFYPETNKVGVQVLMRAFTFEKSLMYQHFNDSYIESDLYPKATFEGEISEFDSSQESEQTRIIKGEFTLRGITKPLEIKASITRNGQTYAISGSVEVPINDYSIKVPALLSPNIAKNIQVTFNFQYELNDDQN